VNCTNSFSYEITTGTETLFGVRLLTDKALDQVLADIERAFPLADKIVVKKVKMAKTEVPALA
jgi:hypothetical protein